MENKDIEQVRDVTLRGEKVSPVEQPEGLSDDELAQQSGEELPDREAMSLINANIAAPVNAAVAANVLSDNSVAYANAQQTSEIIQQS